MTEQLKQKLSDSKVFRWSTLLIVSFTMMFAYFVTDVMAPLQDLLTTKGQIVYYEDGSFVKIEDDTVILDSTKTVDCTLDGLGWSSTEYGFFTGAYGYFNVFLLMLLFGGIILDKMGVRFTGTMSCMLMFFGALIKFWAVSPLFPFTSGEILGYSYQVLFACLGFAIYGMGAEITGITVSKVIVKWFTGHELALAMGLQVAMARIGTGIALGFSLPIARAMGHLSRPLMCGTIALCIGFLFYLVYCVMDRKLEASEKEVVTSSDEDKFKLSDLRFIVTNWGFWLITILCLLFYSGVFPFLKFAVNVMIYKYHVEPGLAGYIPMMLPFGCILLTPLFGSLYDRIGKGATLMIIGSVMLVFVHLCFTLPILQYWWFALALVIILGIAFSLVPSAMWPSVPKIIPQKQLGSAYSLIFYIQNIGLAMVPLLIGWVIEHFSKISSADGTIDYDYTIPLSIFMLFGLLSVVVALMLKRENKRKNYGLEEANMSK